MHRLIVEALGDAEALARVGPDGYLAPTEWGLALERTLARRYGHLPAEVGHRLLGRELAAAFLASPAGHLVAATLPELDLERAFSSVLLPMADRMRRAIEFDFVPTPEGGRVLVHGQRAAHAESIAGFFEVMVERVPGAYAVRVGGVTPTTLELVVSRAPTPPVS
jgi:hypothetical protein